MAKLSDITDLLQEMEQLAPSGFAIAFHLRLTSPDFLFQTYPKDWTDRYSEKGYIMSDPTVRWGFSETGHIRWSELTDQDEAGIFEQGATFGLTYGVAIAVDTDGDKSFAGFSRPDREYDDDEIATLTGFVNDIHEMTASETGMDDDMRDALTRLSLKMTHTTSSDD